LSARSGRSGNGSKSVPLTREALAKLKQKAWRRGCWFRDLKREERMLLDLTIRVVDRVRSFSLASLVSRIVGKLCEAMESRIYHLVRCEGRVMAKSLSEIGMAWGCRAARFWAEDRGFMQFLVVSNLGVLNG
jgi:hypothetical protein